MLVGRIPPRYVLAMARGTGWVGRVAKGVRNRVRVGQRVWRGRLTRVLLSPVASLGANLQLGRDVDLEIYGTLRVGKDCVLSDGAHLCVAPGAVLELGDHVFIGRGTVVVAQQHIHIGSHSLIAEHATIRDQDHHLEAAERRQETQAITAPVHLGDDVWVGAGARILKGCRLGDGAVVAANAVVKSDVAAHTVVGGVPARVLRKLQGG